MTPTNEALWQELARESANTRRLLERIPDDRLGWKPHPKSMSLGQLAGHVAQLPEIITHFASVEVFDFATVEFKPLEPASRAALLKAMDAELETARRRLAGFDEAHMAKPWVARRGETVLMTLPRAAVIRNMLLNHLYHHRGQLTVYLRLLEIPVPALYGPSADENPFA